MGRRVSHASARGAARSRTSVSSDDATHRTTTIRSRASPTAYRTRAAPALSAAPALAPSMPAGTRRTAGATGHVTSAGDGLDSGVRGRTCERTRTRTAAA
jgi:hypothetical protein